MLHDLLFALNGFHGNIFVLSKENRIEVSRGLPFIHDGETVVLDRLCLLATHYKRLTDFIQRHTGLPSYRETAIAADNTGDDGGRLRPGLYLKAFCRGLDQVLEPYRLALLKLEQDILKDPHLTVGHVQQSLEEFHSLFSSLSSLVDQLVELKAHGCYILDLIHKHSHTGFPSLTHALQRIQYVCHCELYKQLTAWMLHGLLIDKHSEFFVHQTSGGRRDDRPEDANDDLGIGGLSGKQLRVVRAFKSRGGAAVDQSVSEDGVRFALRPHMLPSYVETRVADKILFVGESVQMFENDGQKESFTGSSAGSILKEKEAVFTQKLAQLGLQPTFNSMAFESVIDEIRVCVAEHLWKLVVEEHDLLGQLRVIKDFYLLGRGELYLAFIDHAQHLLNPPVSQTTQHDVNVAFQQVAHQVLLGDEELLARLTMTVATPSREGGKKQQQSKSASEKENGWSCLALNYSVQWPLHILFTQTVLDKYNTLFRFLLNLKRVQLELQQCWVLQMERKRAPGQGQGHGGEDRWRLRTHMSFLIDNLQYYLQVDVLESQFSQLVEKIQGTRDFETVRWSHDQFLTLLQTHSFLLTKPVAHCLGEIINQCHAFAQLSLQTVDWSERELTQINKISQSFSRQSSLLFRILSSVQSHQSSLQLTQLMLRIDFNKYYSQIGGIFN